MPEGYDEPRDYSPKVNRFSTDDIEGASPNAYGKARYITGKNYMDIQDIPGAKPRYKEIEERRLKHGALSPGRPILDVTDINQRKP